MPIEIKVRELTAKLLVSSLAVEKGYKVLVGQDRVIRRLIPYLPKGIIFDKSIGRAGDRKVARFSRYNFQIAAMDEESTGYLHDPDSFSSLRLADETLSVTARWFCLCEDVKKDISRRYPDHADKFVTTGLTRTDLWRSMFMPLYQDQVDQIRDRYGKFMLFNSNFTSVIPARGIEFKDRQVKRSSKTHEDFSRKMNHRRSQVLDNLNCYLETLPKLTSWFPEHKLIVRPHPGDDVGFWKKNLGIHPNVEIVGKGSVTPWLLASDCMIHHGCTTGVEAELLGRPHVMYAPKPDDKHDSKTMKAFAPIIKSETELKTTLTKIVNKGKSFNKNRKNLEKYFASLEGKLVSEKVVEEFDKIAIEGGELPSNLNLLRFLPRQLVADYWPRSERAKNYSRQKWDGSSVDEISGTLEKLSTSLKIKSPPVVKEVYPDLFLLEQGKPS